MGGGLLNTGVVCHWNGEIACLRDAESHAVWGKLEQICLEAGSWTGLASGMFIKVSQQWVFSWLTILSHKCVRPACVICILRAHASLLLGGTCMWTVVHVDLAPPPLAAAAPEPPLQSLSWEMY